jgi:hypothetical protein
VLTLFSGRHFMHVRRALALTLAVPVLLAGCSDDPEPTPKMPEPTSSSPSPSPTESEEPEAESPEEFIRRWVEASNEMQNTGETAEYLELSGDCPQCKQVAARVEAAFDAGGFFRTNGWSILKITDRSRSAKRPVLDLRVDSAPTTLKEAKSDEVVRYPGGILVYRFRLRASSPWTIAQLTQVPS